MNTTSRPGSGFTLIEMLVTISIAAVLLMVAVPSMTIFMKNAQLTSFTNTMVAGINAARSEAMKRGRYAMMVPKDNANWSSGWIVFVEVPNPQRTYTYDVSNDILVSTHEAPPSHLYINGTGTANETPPYIMFDASGYPRGKSGFGNLTMNIWRDDVDSSLVLTETRRIKIDVTGRVRTCRPATDLDCS